GQNLNFIGKNYSKKQVGMKPESVIVPNKAHNKIDKNKKSENLLFTGDNLEVLRHLQNSYQSSIDCIYIDPPYNTGKDGFAYPDKFEFDDEELRSMFGLSDEELLKIKSILGKATHSSWLTFMYPRISLAKKLLNDSGVIMISIDDNEQANLRLMMDEVFGESNFIAEIIVDATPKNDPLLVATSHEYVCVYVKNINEARNKEWGEVHPLNKKINQMVKGLSNSEAEIKLREFYKKEGLNNDNISNYKKVDDYGIYRTGPLDDPQSKGPKDQRINPKTGKYLKVPTRGWSTNLSTWNEWVEKKLIEFPTSEDKLPSKKTYLDNNKLEVGRSVIKFQSRKSTNHLRKLFDGKDIFKNPKSIDLIKYLLRILNNKEAKILDFFAGSGTTAEAIMQLNEEDNGKRNYILVQLDEKVYYEDEDGLKAKKGNETAFELGYKSIDQITFERIKRASNLV
ncbi:site-specific DNA-methyltransferase, partial [Staphylococcus pseudintermedius]|nr:site-specific DNA-methyltransferase [Staphylococcus pseudintermedius]